MQLSRVFQCIVLFVHITEKCVKCSSIQNYDSGNLLELVKFENKILDAVDSYVKSLEQRLELAKAYAKELKDSTPTSSVTEAGESLLTVKEKEKNRLGINESRMSEITADPLLSFKLLRRHVFDLTKIEKILSNDYDRNFMRFIEKHRKGTKFPIQKDLDAMTEGILRVHDAYNIDLQELTRGKFGSIQRNSSLSALDCFWIGKYALNANIYTRAVEWLEMAAHLATRHTQDTRYVLEIQKQLEKAIKLHNTEWRNTNARSPYVYQNLIEETTNEHITSSIPRSASRKRVLDNSEYELYKTHSSFSDLTNFAKLCRGELPKVATKRKLKCWLYRDAPYGTLMPLKVEQLHETPEVLQIYDMLPKPLIAAIKQDASGSFSRSKVYGRATEAHKTVSAIRTSFTSWIKSPSVKRDLAAVYKKLGSLLKIDFTAKEACEDLQVTKYDITGHYNPHLDNLMTPELKPNLSPEETEKGDRIATLMFYLSEDMAGGLTGFPRIGVSAYPVEGSALFWFNGKPNGDIDQLSLHGGCPVIYGHKWVANQWIRANSQMFKRPCHKYS